MFSFGTFKPFFVFGFFLGDSFEVDRDDAVPIEIAFGVVSGCFQSWFLKRVAGGIRRLGA
ncbi:MAG TPA: hypothetical protein VNC16_05530 [Solirubrobacterales bacterium]|nr:hypothetical protein [Solirubrobacterales bacterium]